MTWTSFLKVHSEKSFPNLVEWDRNWIMVTPLSGGSGTDQISVWWQISREFFQLICRPFPPEKWPYLRTWKMGTVLNRIKIIFQIIPIYIFWVMADFLYGFVYNLRDTPSVPPTNKIKLFKSGHMYRKDAHWTDNDFLVHDFFLVWLLVFRNGRFCTGIQIFFYVRGAPTPKLSVLQDWEA